MYPSKQTKKQHWHPCKVPDKEPPIRAKNDTLKLNYKDLLKEYEYRHSKKLKPVKHKNKKTKVAKQVYCPYCGATHEYIYSNNGKLRTQFQCKICQHRFASPNKIFKDFLMFCPHCGTRLTISKHRKHANVHRCNNKRCNYKHKYNKRYHYLISHRTYDSIKNLSYPELPDAPYLVNLKKIHFHPYTFNLVISRLLKGLPSRQISDDLKDDFALSISHQTILNYKYAFIALVYPLMQHYLGDFKSSHIIADETYYKVNGAWNYLFVAMDDDSNAILHFNPASHRDADNALRLILDVLGKINSASFELISDKAPIYKAAIEMLRCFMPDVDIIHHTVKGLYNEPGDIESATYRHFKNKIERLNREIKRFRQHKYGFASDFGAFADFAMFVLGHNFLFNYGGKPPPLSIPELQECKTLPNKVAKLVELAQNLVA